MVWLDEQFTRRQVIRAGAAGGGAEDTIDGHIPTSDPDIMRTWQLYEPLAVRNAEFTELEMVLAESLEAEANRADMWTVRLKPGLEFHDGKTVTADDVIFSLRRILDPKDPKVGAASIGYVDAKGLKKMDERTVRIPLEFPNSSFPEDIGQYFNNIVPVDFDPENPVGTGAFKYESFQPGEQSTFVRHPNYWRDGEPYADELVQREQDLDQAESLLRQAGQSDLRVELVTGDIFRGVVEAAQVFAEQAKGAGVTVNVRKVDTGTFYGDNYLSWPFAQDFWATRTYLTQVAQGSLPDSPFNETHWDNKEFQRLIQEARAELDEDRRCELLHEAQRLEYEEGGHIIPYFSNSIDAHTAEIAGITEARSGFTLGNYQLRSVGFVA